MDRRRVRLAAGAGADGRGGVDVVAGVLARAIGAGAGVL